MSASTTTLYNHYHNALYDDNNQLKPYVKPVAIGAAGLGTLGSGYLAYKHVPFIRQLVAMRGRSMEEIRAALTKDPHSIDVGLTTAEKVKLRQGAFDAAIAEQEALYKARNTVPPAPPYKEARYHPVQAINDVQNVAQFTHNALKRTDAYKIGHNIGLEGTPVPKSYKAHPGFYAGYAEGTMKRKLTKKASHKYPTIDATPAEIALPAIGALGGWGISRYKGTTAPVRLALAIGGFGVGTLAGGGLHSKRKKSVISHKTFKKIVTKDPLSATAQTLPILRRLDLENELLAQGPKNFKSKYFQGKYDNNFSNDAKLHYATVAVKQAGMVQDQIKRTVPKMVKQLDVTGAVERTVKQFDWAKHLKKLALQARNEVPRLHTNLDEEQKVLLNSVPLKYRSKLVFMGES